MSEKTTKKKEGIGSKVMGFFFEDETSDDKGTPPENSDQSSNTKPESQSTETVTIPAPPITATIPPIAGVVDPKFADFLSKVIADNNLPGLDYFEFKEALHNMQSMSMSQQQKYEAVFATLSSAGLTKEKLLETAGHYVTVLETEGEKFAKASEGETAKEVTAREQKVVNLTTENESLNKQIQELSDKIQENQGLISTFQGEISEEKTKIQQTVNNFNKTQESLIGKINSDIQNITTFITEPTKPTK